MVWFVCAVWLNFVFCLGCSVGVLRLCLFVLSVPDACRTGLVILRNPMVCVLLFCLFAFVLRACVRVCVCVCLFACFVSVPGACRTQLRILRKHGLLCVCCCCAFVLRCFCYVSVFGCFVSACLFVV